MAGQASWTPMAADFVAANRTNLRLALRRRRFLRTWVLFTIFSAGVGATVGWFGGRLYHAVGFCAAYAALGFTMLPLIYALAYVLAPRRVKRLVHQQRSATLEQTWSWSADEVVLENVQVITRMPWSDLFGWQDSGGMVLLYLNERSFFFLPDRAQSEQGAADLRATIFNTGLRRY
jgi:hypothetical protein